MEEEHGGGSASLHAPYSVPRSARARVRRWWFVTGGAAWTRCSSHGFLRLLPRDHQAQRVLPWLQSFGWTEDVVNGPLTDLLELKMHIRRAVRAADCRSGEDLNQGPLRPSGYL